LILENLERLASLHGNIWLRIPVIPGVNDKPDELEAMARLAAKCKSIRQVNLLPYHQTGVRKFSRLGQEYRLADLRPPSPDYLAQVAEKFSAAGVKVKVGG
jgi:pyruvate formate lyase activating enzyme